MVAILGIGNKSVDYTQKDVEIVSYLADVAWEITERKMAEEEVRRLNGELEQRVTERTRELREAQEKLIRQERLAAVGQLAGGLGHELRKPLTVMANAVYYLRLIQPDAEGKVKEYLGILDKRGVRRRKNHQRSAGFFPDQIRGPHGGQPRRTGGKHPATLSGARTISACGWMFPPTCRPSMSTRIS